MDEPIEASGWTCPFRFARSVRYAFRLQSNHSADRWNSSDGDAYDQDDRGIDNFRGISAFFTVEGGGRVDRLGPDDRQLQAQAFAKGLRLFLLVGVLCLLPMTGCGRDEKNFVTPLGISTVTIAGACALNHTFLTTNLRLAVYTASN